jgi:ABC-type branched-subunit amino acid transport system substrate-binding protein
MAASSDLSSNFHMQASESHALWTWFAFAAAAATVSCNSVVGLDDFSVNSNAGAVGECTTNAQCTARATQAAGSAEPVLAVCEKTEHRCITLKTEDCDEVTGDALDDDAIVLGSLFSTKGAQATTNIQRQQSAMLAVTQINKVGGVPSGSGNPRKLVLVSCDESTDLMRAAGHLVTELKVPGIIGPNTSQDTLDLSAALTVESETVMMSPTAVASSIASLVDNDLTWLMVPSDVQRAPLMISQINAIETELKTNSAITTVKLGIVFRDDALGTGTRTALSTLILNGEPLSDPVNLGKNVEIDPYDFTKTDQAEIVSKYLTFAPDIIVLAGTAEAITNVMKPLEAMWTAARRPQYVLIDSVKVPDLIQVVTENNDLRRRIRGTGITPDDASIPVYNAFKVDYQIEYSVGSANTSGMGPAYDATYAMAFALAATKNEPVSGRAIAKGLRMLAGGPTKIEVSGTTATQAFQRLAAGEKISAIGTFGPLEWDPNGAVLGGTLEMWCIGAPGMPGTPTYQSSGLFFDIKLQQETGEYTQCRP